MNHVEGFVAAVPNVYKQKYIAHAKQATSGFMDHVAIKFIECWCDDIVDCSPTTLPKAVQCREDETVGFKWLLTIEHTNVSHSI